MIEIRVPLRRIHKTNPFTRRNVGPSQITESCKLIDITVDPDEAPTGMMARGHYEAISKFQDDDKHDYLKFEWSFDITKDWK